MIRTKRFERIGFKWFRGTKNYVDGRFGEQVRGREHSTGRSHIVNRNGTSSRKDGGPKHS
jgi:hypothetical protein